MVSTMNLPPLPNPDIVDIGRFGVAWREDKMRAYGEACRTKWLPIETAPQDGTRVLLCFPHIVEAGRFDDDRYGSPPRPYWAGDNEHLWGIRYYRAHPPTAWMPLPQVPGE